MTYTIEQFTTPISYDDPIQPEPSWMACRMFYGKSRKTEGGAQRALAKPCTCATETPASTASVSRPTNHH